MCQIGAAILKAFLPADCELGTYILWKRVYLCISQGFFCLFCSSRCERACFRSLDHFGVATMPFKTATATKVAMYAYSMALKPSKVLWQVSACVKGNESRKHGYLGPYGSTLTNVVWPFLCVWAHFGAVFSVLLQTFLSLWIFYLIYCVWSSCSRISRGTKNTFLFYALLKTLRSKQFTQDWVYLHLWCSSSLSFASVSCWEANWIGASWCPGIPLVIVLLF